MNYWEIIANKLKKSGWNCGYLSSTDGEDRQFWVAAAEREDAGRFIVHAHDMFPKKDHAIDYAQNRACFRSGEIRVLDSSGNVEHTIGFHETNRRL